MKTNGARRQCFGAALILLLLAPAYAQVAPPGSLPRSQSREPAVASPSGASTVPLQRGFVANSANQTLYQLPAGAYVVSYRDATGTLQQVDATVTWDPRQIKHDRREVPDAMTISFDGRNFAGVIAAGGNRFASSQTAAGQPVLDGELSANGAMSGHYFADDHGYPVRNPFQYTLSPKPVANLGTEQRTRSGVAVSPASPGSGYGTNAIAGTRPGSREALNPQPLPSMPGPNWNAKPGDASSLNPQPLPPIPGPNWNAKPGTPGSLSAQSVPSGGSIVANPRSAAAGISQTAESSKAAAAGQHVRRQSTAASRPVSDLAARRLRAAGLDPTSPTFRKQLDDRLQTIANGLTSQAAAATARKPVADLVRSKLRAPSNVATTTAQLQSAESHVARPAVTLAPSPEPASTTLDALPPVDILTGSPPYPGLQMPFPYVIPFTPTNSAAVARLREQGSGDSLSARVTIPACGIDYAYVADLQTAEQMGGIFRAGFGYQTGSLNGRVFAWFPDFNTPGSQLAFPLGASLRHGTVSLTVNGLTTVAPFEVDFMPGRMLDSGWSVAIDSSAPFLGANSMGLTADNTAFAQPTIDRVNLGDQPMEGEDVVGTGVQTGAGYAVAYAQIIAAHSVADLGGDAAADNAYRGATIVNQPQSNRLQTTVKWHIAPGDSLQYQILWTMRGPEGQRPFMSMPLQGACDS